MIQLELETPLGKALIEEDGYSGEYLLHSLIRYIHVAPLGACQESDNVTNFACSNIADIALN